MKSSQADSDQPPVTTTTAWWDADVRETHSAVVILLADRAYKVKKPVDLGFLDFRTRPDRERACRRELVLNRRMAPDVYLGVAEVRGPDGAPCEHVLVMRRMPDQRRLSTLVGEGVDVREDLRRLAKVVAAFHAASPTDDQVASSGTPDALRGRWLDNLESLRQIDLSTLRPEIVARLQHLAMDYVAGRQPLLQSRIDAHLVRDGHGDLLADDIFCLPDGPRALDCLDFADELRWMDVLDDVACLAMDLERLGAPALARVLLEAYEEFSGSPQPQSLRHHYVAYRAVMRAKVAAIRALEHADRAGSDAAEAALLCHIGLSHLVSGRVHLVLVGGTPGSGKTTVAGGLADALGAVTLSTDRERKQLMGLPPTAHASAPYGSGIYTPQITRETYASLASRTRTLLGMGESVVVDGSFADAEYRAMFRLVGLDTVAHVVELRCTAARSVTEARLRERRTRPARYSDADLEVGRHLADRWQEWPQAVSIDTGGTPGAAVSAALATVTDITASEM